MNGNKRSKNRRIIPVKFICAGVMLAVIIWVISLGWFTMNSETEANGAAAAAVDLPFDIATEGDDDEEKYESQLKEADSEYSDGVTAQINSKVYYKTDYSNSKLILRYDVNNADIGPGGSGELNFYIIPKNSGSFEADINLDVIGCIEIKKDKKTQVIEVTDSLTADSTGLTADEISDCQSAAKYLGGHIMFFEKKSENENYSYENPLTDRTYHFSVENAVAGTAYPVSVQWMWTNTLGQIALKTNSANLRNGTPIVEETEDSDSDKAKVIQYLKDNKESIFTNSADIDDDMIDNADDTANFEKLSEGYNEADLIVGTNISYFIIEVTVSAN